MRHGREHCAHQKLCASGDHVHQRRRRAFVGNMLRLYADALREHHRGKVRAGTGARRRKIKLPRSRLGIGDELRHGLDRQSRMGEKNQTACADLSNWRNVFQRIVGEFGIKPRRHRDRVARVHQRLAVAGRPREYLHRDIARRPRTIVYHHLLADLLRDFFADDARHHVGRPARREPHQHAHRPDRPHLPRAFGSSLRLRGNVETGAHAHADQCSGTDRLQSRHGFLGLMF